MEVKQMSDEFHEWLCACPVQWFLAEVGDDWLQYRFQHTEDE